ncbi:MAG: peroxidase family protein [Roseobacter sp.]
MKATFFRYASAMATSVLCSGLGSTSSYAATLKLPFIEGLIVEPVTFDSRPTSPKDLPALARIGAANYADVGNIGDMLGDDLTNARRLSERLSTLRNLRTDPVPLNNLAVVAHQFWSSHTIAKTPTEPTEQTPIQVFGPVAGDLRTPADPLLAGGVGEIAFARSVLANGSGVTTPRAHVNEVSAKWDASPVYGSFLEENLRLRADDFATTGKLKTGENGDLPVIDGRPSAGDARADENPNLQSFHALWLREHNRLADDIASSCPGCSGEEIFAAAQKLNANLQFKVIYDELLPALLGPGSLESHLPDPSKIPAVENVFTEFSAAAGRIGHTQVPDTILLSNPDGSEKASVPLSDCFFASDCLGGATETEKLLGALLQPAEAIDLHVVPGLQDLLVLTPFGPAAADLKAINIQRGRDHGLPGYLAMRHALGFDDVPLDDLLPSDVLDAYGIIDGVGGLDGDIDLLIGLFAEHRDSVTDFLGSTGKALWAAQFIALQETAPGASDAETQEWLEAWRSEQSMADVLFRDAQSFGIDFDTTLVGRNVFFADGYGGPGIAAAVPLPGSLMALLTGLGALGSAASRRRFNARSLLKG